MIDTGIWNNGSDSKMLKPIEALGYDVMTKNHAEAILVQDFAGELQEVVQILLGFRIGIEEILAGGGGEASFTQRMRHALSDVGWPKHTFNVQTIVDNVEREGISHEIDHVRTTREGQLALEIEWNNKDPFYDRDLENFQRLHAISAISVGIIITRGRSMQENFHSIILEKLRKDGIRNETDLERYGILERTSGQRNAVARKVERGADFAEAFTQNFVMNKFGQATTHWDKLIARVNRGVGNPCPLLLLGMPDKIITMD